MSSRLAYIPAVLALSAGVGWNVGLKAQTCTPIRPDLLSWWDAGRTAESQARDLSGRNPGSMNGGVRVVADPGLPGPRNLPYAFQFDGSGYIDVGKQAFQFGTKPFSLEAWFASARGSAQVPHLISKSNYPVDHPGAGYWIRLSPDGQQIEFFIGETLGLPGFPNVRITSPVSPGVWHHVVGTKDAAGSVKMYLDGRPVGSDNIPPAFSVNSRRE